MQLISKFNKGYKFSLCVVDIFSKYDWIVPLKDKKVLVLLMVFKVLDDSNRKPNKIWVNKRSEFYNNSFRYIMKENRLLLKDLSEH